MPYSATKRIMVFRTASGRAAAVGREEMDARSQLVSSTHAGRGMWSRTSEISPRGEVKFLVWTAKFEGVVLAAALMTFAAAFFLDFPAALLGAAVNFGPGFRGLAV